MATLSLAAQHLFAVYVQAPTWPAAAARSRLLAPLSSPFSGDEPQPVCSALCLPRVRAQVQAQKMPSCCYNDAALSRKPQWIWGSFHRLDERASLLCCPLDLREPVCGWTLCFGPASDSGFIIFPSTVIMPLIIPGNEKPQMLSAQRPCTSLLYPEFDTKLIAPGKQLEARMSTVTLIRGGLAQGLGQLRPL